MKKNLGIFQLLVGIIVLTALLQPAFLKPANIQNVMRWTALFGLIGIGVSFVIITGGIDLSIGSLMAMAASMSVIFLTEWNWPPVVAFSVVMLMSVLVGLIHGGLITKLKLQPFVVTLCGMMLYRGIARVITRDDQKDFGGEQEFAALKFLAGGKIPSDSVYAIPFPVVMLVVVGIIAHVFLNRTIYGRYLFALGNNENAARYSGINTDAMKATAYIICSTLAGFTGILFALDINSVAPNTFGNWYELYAIAAAVLGGCSLRGGEGSIVGVILGTAIMRVLYNSINILQIPTRFEFIMIGGIILFGAVADELAKSMKARKNARKSAQNP
ncbi:MAG: ABC transporter permease [Verrucomicrobia bacterium]|nr:ABC transporter permease [Verrucomicrobiota bacterium]